MRTTRNSANNMETLLCGLGILMLVFVIVKILKENDLMNIVVGVVVIIVVGFGYYSIKKIKEKLYEPKTHNAVMFHSVASKGNIKKQM